MDAPVVVRTFVEADLEPVCALWDQVFSDHAPRNEPRTIIRRKQREQPELMLVAEQEGRVVGTVLAGFDGCRGWVHHVAVDPVCRRSGVGRALMGAAEAGLAAVGCPKLNLQVLADNPEAVRFYERLGYRTEERVSMARLLEPERS